MLKQDVGKVINREISMVEQERLEREGAAI